MDPLLPSFRRELRARAHHLHPVVTVGQHGLTPRVLHEIDVALTAHELVKVRVFNDDRAERETMLAQISGQLACTPVQHLGKLLILWRRHDDEQADVAAERKPRGRKPAGEATRRPASSSAPNPSQATRRRRHAAEPVNQAVSAGPARGRARSGQAPAGVPRAAAPRRRRSR